jgi:hypothetical protein
MCAVISCPFWAGWLNKITAHTPALIQTIKHIRDNEAVAASRGRFCAHFLHLLLYLAPAPDLLPVYKINRHRVRNDSLLEPFVQ